MFASYSPITAYLRVALMTGYFLAVTSSGWHANALEPIGLPPVNPPANEGGIVIPPKVKTEVTTPADTQVQRAITPANRVHTQVRLGFLDQLFGNDVIGELSDKTLAELTKAETQLYGRTYTEQKLGKRLTRLEKTTLQNKAYRGKQPVTQRWQAIQQALGDKVVMSSQRDDDQPSENTLAITVTYMENRLYQEAYPHEPLDQRLTRVETTVYGHPKAGQSTQARVKHLAEHFPLAPTGVAVLEHATTIAPVIAPMEQVDTASQSQPSPPLLPKADNSATIIPVKNTRPTSPLPSRRKAFPTVTTANTSWALPQ